MAQRAPDDAGESAELAQKLALDGIDRDEVARRIELLGWNVLSTPHTERRVHLRPQLGLGAAAHRRRQSAHLPIHHCG
ncbi:hypothetical protein D3C84_912260 [compost metagenome]